MKPTADLSEPEFSYALAVDKIPPSGMEVTLNANADQRARLATRFGLLELSRLSAQLTAEPARGGTMIAVTGTMEAEAMQQCVVSLEPLEARIAHEIDVLFASEKLVESADIEAEGEDIEPIVNGQIDFGELVAQHLGVGLDPYPRKPGLAYVEAEYGSAPEAASPFSILASIKKKPKK